MSTSNRHQITSSDYAHCVGIDYFGRKEPCKSCRRMIPFNVQTETAMTWIQPQYNEATGKCPLYDAKTNNNNFNNNENESQI